jgi:hypothetical protein
MKLLALALLAATLAFHLFIPPARTRTQDVNRLKAAVVRIENTRFKDVVGSGFIVKIDGKNVYIVTAAHVVKGGQSHRIFLFAKQDEPLFAEVLDRQEDDTKGLALLLLKSDAQTILGLTALKLGPSNDLGNGENVKVIGFPGGTSIWTVESANIIRLQGSELILSEEFKPGTSGGPVILNERVVGLVTDVNQSDGQAARAEIIVPYVNGFKPNLIAIEAGPVPVSGEASHRVEAQTLMLNVSLDKIEVFETGSPGSTRWAFEVFANSTSAFLVNQRRYTKGKPIEINMNREINVEPDKYFTIKVVGDKSEQGIQAIGQVTLHWDPRETQPLLKQISVKVPGNIKKGNFTFHFTIKRQLTEPPSVEIKRADGKKMSDGDTVPARPGDDQGSRLNIEGTIKGVPIAESLRICVFAQSNSNKQSGVGYCQACVSPDSDGEWNATTWLGHLGGRIAEGDGRSVTPYGIMAVLLEEQQLASLGLSSTDCGETSVNWKKVKSAGPSHEIKINVYLPALK